MSDWLAARMVLPPIGAGGWLRVVWRGGLLAVLCYGGLAALMLVRLLERPLFGAVRPVSPWITVGVCRVAVRLLGLRMRVRGVPMRVQGAQVANHAGWLDIFTLNAVQPLYFVSKAEVAGWAGIGVLARAVGTVFIARKASEAAAQARMLAGRLAAGHRLLLFPEGTSSDAQRVLPFKPALFEAFFAEGLRDTLHVQPVTVVYHAPEGRDARFYGWWGDMAFAPHFLAVLAHPGGAVEVTFHDPVRVADFPDRKALAGYCHTVIGAGFGARFGTGR